MWTIETAQKALDGYSDTCPNGHFMPNLGDLVKMCSHCGQEVVIECPECAKEAQGETADPPQWVAVRVLEKVDQEHYLLRQKPLS